MHENVCLIHSYSIVTNLQKNDQTAKLNGLELYGIRSVSTPILIKNV